MILIFLVVICIVLHSVYNLEQKCEIISLLYEFKDR